MHIYTNFVFHEKLISPINEYSCRRITKQNIKNFGFDSVEDLLKQYPQFPLICEEYRLATGKDPSGMRKKGIKESRANAKANKVEAYNSNMAKCKRCSTDLSYKSRKSTFCSARCSNLSRDPMSEETKSKIGSKVKIYRSKNKQPTKKKRLSSGNCKVCHSELPPGRPITCSNECLIQSRKLSSRIKTAKEQYRIECSFKFNVYDYPNHFDLDLLENFGWYKAKNRGDNPEGISRDHMLSVKYGFDNGVDPIIISHPANCMLMSQRQNASKNSKSGITLEELSERIYLWNIGGDTEVRTPPSTMQMSSPPRAVSPY